MLRLIQKLLFAGTVKDGKQCRLMHDDQRRAFSRSMMSYTDTHQLFHPDPQGQFETRAEYLARLPASTSESAPYFFELKSAEYPSDHSYEYSADTEVLRVFGGYIARISGEHYQLRMGHNNKDGDCYTWYVRLLNYSTIEKHLTAFSNGVMRYRTFALPFSMQRDLARTLAPSLRLVLGVVLAPNSLRMTKHHFVERDGDRPNYYDIHRTVDGSFSSLHVIHPSTLEQFFACHLA